MVMTEFSMFWFNRAERMVFSRNVVVNEEFFLPFVKDEGKIG